MSNALAAAPEILQLAEELRRQVGGDFHEKLMEDIYAEAGQIADRSVRRVAEGSNGWERALDRAVTSRIWGFPLMILLLLVVFWITISAANVPSQFLSTLLLGIIYPALLQIADAIGMPSWLSGVLIEGMYRATAWVVAVMLPPMAIFFPLFTLLEDFGYLPRVAFNLDSTFRKAGAHGKQALSTMMGFGCNAAGVVSTRIIDSPRERLLAILTNNFALCNGRWPTQILLASVVIGSLVPAVLAGVFSALAVAAVAILGIGMTFAVSWGLSRSVLKGEVSTFSLELPPYRRPQFTQTIYTSLIDRTLKVLWRAVVFAMPAGAVIWLIANVTVQGVSLAEYMVNFLEPIGLLLGLNGIILVAFIVAIPANEIVIPTILMLTLLIAGSQGTGFEAGVLLEASSTADIMLVFRAGGWTLLTAVNLMLFSLLHNPCSTTIYTIYRETGSRRWTTLASLLPLAIGLMVTFTVAQVWRLFLGPV